MPDPRQRYFKDGFGRPNQCAGSRCSRRRHYNETDHDFIGMHRGRYIGEPNRRHRRQRPNATDEVVIRGLDLDGLGTGLSGIKVITGGSVSVENCTINHFTVSGSHFAPTVAGSQLHVINTIIRNNGVLPSSGQGILITPSAAATAHLDHVTLEFNVAGLKCQGSSITSVSSSIAANNAFAGFSGAASPAILNIERSTSSNNGTGVVCATGTTVRIGNMSIA